MNLSHLSLYRGADIRAPSNQDRLQELRRLIPPPLSNQVFRFKRKKANSPSKSRKA